MHRKIKVCFSSASRAARCPEPSHRPSDPFLPFWRCISFDPTRKPLTFVVMGSDKGGGLDEAAAFFDYVTTNFSMTSSHWVMYNTESEFTDIIGESGYSRDPADERPAFSVGIVFTAGSPDWAYTVSEGWSKTNNCWAGLVFAGALPLVFY